MDDAGAAWTTLFRWAPRPGLARAFNAKAVPGLLLSGLQVWRAPDGGIREQSRENFMESDRGRKAEQSTLTPDDFRRQRDGFTTSSEAWRRRAASFSRQRTVLVDHLRQTEICLRRP